MSKNRKPVIKTRSVEDLLRLLEEVEGREANHIKDFEDAESTIAELEAAVEGLEDQVRDLENQIVDLEGQLDDLERENEENDRFAELMSALRELIDEYEVEDLD